MLKLWLNSIKSCAVRWLEKNRGIVVVLFCLPASFIFDLVIKLNFIIQRCLFYSGPEHHFTKVQGIQKEVREWNELSAKERKPLCTAKPNWLSLSTKFFNKKNCHQIPIPLYNILELDTEKLSLKVEPNASVYDMTSYLIPKGYTLAVTLEIGDATAGGLALGVGMTTHSHKVGLFQETILSYDVVLADGSVIHVTKDNEHSDLFYCLPWSHGTLAFLIHTQDEYCEEMMKLSGAIGNTTKVPDFLEATIFDRENAVIMCGNFADVDTHKKIKRINHVSRWRRVCAHKRLLVETQQIHFLGSGRHDSVWQPSIISIDARLAMPSKARFFEVHNYECNKRDDIFKAGLSRYCDALKTLKAQVNTATELFNTFPLLVYPCKIFDHKTKGSLGQGQLRSPSKDLLTPNTNFAMYNDLGVYGTPAAVKRHEPYNPTKAMRAMEKFTRDKKSLSKCFDLRLYKQVRQKYYAERAFPSLFDKIKPEINVIEIGNKEYL
uniref:FAD linked oxidase N-terminal domain-containing protein n=1 Tax=Ditylenchus dipsaci TaxID=166011 RepID=A0A915ER80_9BILA